MANYVGVHCPVCDKRFADGDDIVVCPICGAPHHRECYQKTGHCALEELHLKGHTWQASEKQAQTDGNGAPGEAVCPACGAHNPRSGIFCQVCGAPLGHGGEGRMANPYGNPFAKGNAASGTAYTAAFGGLSPDEEIEEESARDIALFIGNNSYYFLPRFKLLSRHGGITFNWAALLFHAFYFLYRKMYLAGACIFGVLLLTYIPEFMTLKEQTFYLMQNMADLFNGNPVAEFVPTEHLWAYKVVPVITSLRIMMMAVLSMFANRIYMRHVLTRVRQIREHFSDESGRINDGPYVKELSSQGRTMGAGWMVLLVVTYFIVSTAIKMLFVLLG
ncbi:RING finger protein [Marasmitruncus massiliensis]|uniref:RING finger protein n=1 Tax=Marasmitruncus massiliensis TaxID=1944642 RepID=UPI0015E0C8F4|nr:RING finger protein [Marasmitruncus massiliensis]